MRSQSFLPPSRGVALLLLPLACSAPPEPSSADDAGALRLVREDPTDSPLAGLTDEQLAVFAEGDVLFEDPLRESQGLGPLFIRRSCGSCHADDAKGPGAVNKMVFTLEDGFTPAPDQSALPFGFTVRPYATAGASTPITAPEGVKLTTRVGPAVFGRGYLEAIREDEILRMEQLQQGRADGVSGRVSRVTYHSVTARDRGYGSHTLGETNLVGRFGLKARVVSLDDFTADAYQGDMGITSPLRPNELPNPDGLGDDERPGLDVTLETVEKVSDYVRMLAIPRRAEPEAGAPELFEQAGCAVCHVPSLRTRADHPLAPLRDVDAPVYTDLLLHDMGAELADAQTDENAEPREWRTAPLVGLRHLRSLMHDGRASTVADAIRHHRGEGSEANASVDLYDALSVEQQQKLIRFVESL
ncbi:MAG: di-heme oxidoredictase family protein [Myxococcota bacterium]